MWLCNGLQFAFFPKPSEHARSAETKTKKNWIRSKGASAAGSKGTGNTSDTGIWWTRFSFATDSTESTGGHLSVVGDDVALRIGYSKRHPDDGGQVV